MSFQLTTDQKKAIEKAIKWYYIDSYKKNYFTIGGVAGSGKSTIVSHLIKLLGLQTHEVLFVCYTGKAALRLRIAGNNAYTIHSTFYGIVSLPSGEVRFYKKSKIDSCVHLIIVDEISMVPNAMTNDILSFGVPTIMLGDPKQLDPIMSKKNTFCLEENLDVFLSEPMRFNDESGILELSKLARENQLIPYGYYKKSKVLHYREIEHELHKYDMVVCYKNSTRKQLNVKIRKQLGCDSTIFPVKGEKVICLKNNYNVSIQYNDLKIFLINGLIGVLLEDSYIDKKTGLLKMKFIPDFMLGSNYNEYFDIQCYPQYFETNYYDIELPEMFLSPTKEKDRASDITAFMTFSYAIGLYKYQGSEADNVCCIIDDFPPSHPNYSKFVYTAITRAKESVTVATFK